jgi:hypothetical protein
MPELERELRTLGRALEFPPTPDIGAAVATRIREGEVRRIPAPRTPVGARRGWRVLAVAVALLLLAAATALAVSPSVRDALSELFGLSGATIERTATPPPEPAAPQAPPGRASSLAQARRALAFERLLPAELRAPAAVFVDDQPAGGTLSAGYRPGPGLPRAATTGFGLLVTEFRGDLAPEYLAKIVPTATRVERLRLDGSRGAWIAGAPHFFAYRDTAGNLRESELAVGHNVLLLERGRLLVRLEGDFGRRQAVRLARSLR